MTGRTTLYRFFDVDERLLYVGIGGNPGRRFDQHAKGHDAKPWWSQVAGSTMEHFDTRDEALAAEKHAIQTEAPLYNVVHNTRPSTTQTDQVDIYCLTCGGVILGESGHLEVDVQAARSHASAMAAASAPGVVELGILMDAMRAHPPARWVAFHHACDPHPDADPYWISASRISTMPEILRFIAHVLDKRWVTGGTNIDDLVHALADRTYPFASPSEPVDKLGETL